MGSAKHGLHTQPVVEAMLAIGEKPRAFYLALVCARGGEINVLMNR